MKQKLPAIVFLLLFVLLCLTPSVGMVLFGASGAVANERLAPVPTLKEKDGSVNQSYLSGLAEAFAGRFFLRQELISADNALSGALFGVSGEEDVLLGTDGWLYYADTVADYTGTAPMSGRELFSAVNDLALMQEYCASQGAAFLFAIAPNKNSLYPEHMPSLGAVSAEHDAAKLLRLAAERGVRCADLFAPFAGEAEPLYFAHDSHWNSRGAALAADVLLAAFGRESAWFAGDFSRTQPHRGDLFDMLYPALTDRESDPVYGGELSFETEGNTRPDSITIRAEGTGSGSLLCFRDSFGNLLYPYLAASFANARFSRLTAYDLTLIGETQADCVLVELVERNLRYLLTNVPVMPAPERTLPAADAAESAVPCTRQAGARGPEGCVLFSSAGSETLAAAAQEQSRIYLCCGETGYEAFLQAGGGFAAYLPAGAEVDALILTGPDGALRFPVSVREE